MQDDAAARVARGDRASCPTASTRFADALDDGTPIARRARVVERAPDVRLHRHRAPSAPANLNAPRAVTVAAVLYVLRAWSAAPIPLNGGCLRPVVDPRPRAASLLSPSPGRAVAGGNVETSQRVVDVLLGALGLAAASQGTMNNLTFGDAALRRTTRRSRGGAGAGPGFDGASARAHAHDQHAHHRSRGARGALPGPAASSFACAAARAAPGAAAGGDGIVRELELLAPMRVSILSERRARAPFGLAGGQPGAPGRNVLAGVARGGCVEADLDAGDRIRIETPGGGGYGAPPRDEGGGAS